MRAGLLTLSLAEVSEHLRSRKISPVELTHASLDRIARCEPKLNAFITVTADSALAEARVAEAEIQRRDWKGALHGVPIALKDNIDTAGVRTTAASALLKDRVPQEDAEIVRRLKAAGAITLGKTNLHEFAFGASSAISEFGPVRNPWDLNRSTGGSSGGSAAAVSARLCFGAIGTDTGGSVREPASYCGIVGFKPTYGRVSNAGVIPLSWSLDHVGPLTRTAKDAALLLQVMAGYDACDISSANVTVPNYVAGLEAPTDSLRLGIPRAFFYDETDPEIAKALDEALRILKTLCKSQIEIQLFAGEPDYLLWKETVSTVFLAEAYAYHRNDLEKMSELYQTATRQRLQPGANISAAKYIQSRRKLEWIRRTVTKIFDDVDLLIAPTVRVPPFSIVELQDLEGLRAKELKMLHNTRPMNLTGLPTISVPCGFTSDGMPIGMQITGRPWDETTALRLAHAYQRETDWHQRAPNF